MMTELAACTVDGTGFLTWLEVANIRECWGVCEQRLRMLPAEWFVPELDAAIMKCNGSCVETVLEEILQLHSLTSKYIMKIVQKNFHMGLADWANWASCIAPQ